MIDCDVDLLERWAHGRDAEAFRQLVSRYAGMVYGTCTRILRNHTDAEDAAQECFQALARVGTTPGAFLGAWLHRVATNIALNRLRNDRRRSERERRYADMLPVSSDVSWNNIYSLVDEAISELPDRLRQPVVAYFLYGEKQERIAESLGVSRQTVVNRIEKGLERLRDALKKKGYPVTGVVLAAFFKANACVPVPESLMVQLGRLALAGPVVPAGAVRAWTGSATKAAAFLATLIIAGIVTYSFVRQPVQNKRTPVVVSSHDEGEALPVPATPASAMPAPTAPVPQKTAIASQECRNRSDTSQTALSPGDPEKPAAPLQVDIDADLQTAAFLEITESNLVSLIEEIPIHGRDKVSDSQLSSLLMSVGDTVWAFKKGSSQLIMESRFPAEYTVKPSVIEGLKDELRDRTSIKEEDFPDDPKELLHLLADRAYFGESGSGYQGLYETLSPSASSITFSDAQELPQSIQQDIHDRCASMESSVQNGRVSTPGYVDFEHSPEDVINTYGTLQYADVRIAATDIDGDKYSRFKRYYWSPEDNVWLPMELVSMYAFKPTLVVELF